MQISQMNADCVEFFTQVSGAKPSDNENDSSSFSFFFWGYEHDLFAYPVLWRALRVKVAAKFPLGKGKGRQALGWVAASK